MFTMFTSQANLRFIDMINFRGIKKARQTRAEPSVENTPCLIC